MKKIYYIIVLTLLFLTSCNSFVKKVPETGRKDTTLMVGNFDLSDYNDELAEFPGDRFFGPIVTPKQAIEAAKEIWIEKLSAGNPINGEPIMVCYDENSDCWLVYGTLPDDPSLLGEVPYAIIRKSDGKVLAVWGG